MLPFDPRALAVIDRLSAAGFHAVLVGGCVRDSLLSVPPHDYDAATAALPKQIGQVFADLRCVDTGLKHGTVTVLSDGLPVEVTTFRKEGGYTDHRRPDRVEFTGDLAADLARRDFTVNAMAWSPGGIVDLYGGRDDLKNKLIRCVGDPDRRFTEDALRPLRGLRLAAQLGFALEGATAAAVRRHLPELAHVAWERISGEFLRLICSPGAEQILLDFPELAAQVLPELAPAMGFDQHSPHHRYDVYTHSVKALGHLPPVPALRLAALLHDAGKPACSTLDAQGTGHFYGHPKLSVQLAEAALARLRLDRATRERALALIARHHLPVEPTRQWAGRWLARLGPELFFQLLALMDANAMACGTGEDGREPDRRRARELAQALLEQQPCLSLKDLAVNGRDAMAAGLSGPAVGAALRALLDQVSAGELENRRELLLARLKDQT